MKGVGLLWVFLNHAVEWSLECPLIANPAHDWSSFEQRWSQLAPIRGCGIADLPYNVFRYLGFTGETGVQLFLICSGFGLTYGLLRRGAATLDTLSFYHRRLWRILPTWWIAHLLVLLASLPVLAILGGKFAKHGVSIGDPELYLSLLGLRVTNDSLYYAVPAWWFIGLILQLYAVYPLLWIGLRRRDALRLLFIGTIVAWAIRLAGLVVFEDYLAAWSRGAIFITRLPEFLFGIALASWCFQEPERTKRQLGSPVVLATAVLSVVVGLGSALTLVGNAISPFFLGAGCFVLLYHVLSGSRYRSAFGKSVLWIGRHSYSLMIVHQPLIQILLPRHATSAVRLYGGLAACARRECYGRDLSRVVR